MGGQQIMVVGEAPGGQDHPRACSDTDPPASSLLEPVDDQGQPPGYAVKHGADGVEKAEGDSMDSPRNRVRR